MRYASRNCRVVVDATVVVVIITDVVPDAMVADGLTMSAIAAVRGAEHQTRDERTD